LLALSSRAAKPITDAILRRIDAGEKPGAAEIKAQITKERLQAQDAMLKRS